MASLEEKKMDIERSIKLAKKAPKVRLDKRGKIIESEQELYRRALKKQEHLRTYSEKSGYFSFDSHAERASQKEKYRILRLQKESKRVKNSKVQQGGTLDFAPHQPDESPGFSSTTSPRKQRLLQQSSKTRNTYDYKSLPLGAYDYTGVSTDVEGVPFLDQLSGKNIVREVYGLHPVK